eukprot:XP_001693323.1 predicted protein [Chlamydomonas reinhardtii]
MRRSGLALLRGAASLGSSSGAYAPSSFVVTARKLVHAESPAVVAFPSCTGLASTLGGLHAASPLLLSAAGLRRYA